LAHDAHQVRKEGERRQPHEHERDRLVARLRFAAFGGSQRGPDDAEHDRRNGDPLAPSGVLSKHAPAEEQQHEQAGGERRLHDDERREQQRHDLQRPTEYRQAGAEQPARSHHEVAREAEAQMHVVRGALGVHRLQRHP
jgi:hypothetical protein